MQGQVEVSSREASASVGIGIWEAAGIGDSPGHLYMLPMTRQHFVLVFVDILVEFDKYHIRTTNNLSRAGLSSHYLNPIAKIMKQDKNKTYKIKTHRRNLNNKTFLNM